MTDITNVCMMAFVGQDGWRLKGRRRTEAGAMPVGVKSAAVEGRRPEEAVSKSAEEVMASKKTEALDALLDAYVELERRLREALREADSLPDALERETKRRAAIAEYEPLLADLAKAMEFVRQCEQ